MFSLQSGYYRSESDQSVKSDGSNTQSESDDLKHHRSMTSRMISMDVIDLDDLRKGIERYGLFSFADNSDDVLVLCTRW